MKLIDYIQTYDDVIHPDTCKLIIDDYEKHIHLTEKHDTNLYKFEQLNLNQTPEFQPIAQAFANSLVPVFEEYFKSLHVRQYVDIETFEDVRIKKYVKGSSDVFRTHVDVTDHASASRFAIAILYLNDNDGLTTFPNLGVGVKPKAGRVVIFPPSWMFPHNGLTPSDNDKYIMMTSLRYV